METVIYSIAKNFSRTPGPRYVKEGPYSGELFRRDFFLPVLIKAIESNSNIVADLDGTHGYGTSFLEETFGGLIRINKIDYDTIIKHIKFKSIEEEYLIEDIMEYLKQAQAEEECEKV
jgi:hypothetical protein